ncbi:MAG: septum formation initiator family protein [Clostridia bacterium]|nr:septum formation initiator family protein [Clostridia bacterium]
MQQEQNRKKADSGKGKPKRKFNPRKFAVAAVILLFGAYFCYTMIWQQVALNRKSREIDALNAQIEEATRQTEQLEAELENLNDPAYLEKVAREKLGLVRPNERVFVDANKSEANTSN